MPIYEYSCQSCEHTFEKLQRMSDEPLVDCPECEQPKLIKLVSAAGFQLKGSGWYVTDFKDKKPKAAKEGASAASDSGNSQAAKSSQEATSTPTHSKVDTAKSPSNNN